MPIYKTDKKKDGKQGYRVIVCYTDALGKAHNVERIAYGSAEAKAVEATLRQDIKSNNQHNRNLTVNDLYNEYITSKSLEIRESTLDKTRRNLKLYILPTFEKMKISKLSDKALLQKWKNNMVTLGLSTRTLQNIYGEFRALINYAVKMDYLSKNNLVVVGNFKDIHFEKPQDKLNYYTAQQFKKYISAAKEQAEIKNTITEWGYYVFFNLAFYCGLRKGEINALKWSDIDGNIINIRRSITQKIKGGDRETPPKNKNSYRSIQLPLPLIQILEEHKQRQMKDENFSEDFRICGGIKILRDTSIEVHNQMFAKKADLPHIRIHDFRHSHASLLVNEGINIQEVARRLGHSDIQTTWQTYAHLYPREEERAVAILNKI